MEKSYLKVLDNDFEKRMDLIWNRLESIKAHRDDILSLKEHEVIELLEKSVWRNVRKDITLIHQGEDIKKFIFDYVLFSMLTKRARCGEAVVKAQVSKIPLSREEENKL